MSHSIHRDIHEHGLQDNCPECHDHAMEPWYTLDETMLSNLIHRNFFYRWGYKVDASLRREDYEPRSDTEALAMANITNVMERVGKLFVCDPDHLMQYFFERVWGIEFESHAG